MTELKVKCQCCGHFQRVVDYDIEALNKQIRADAIEEYFAKFDNWIKSDSKLSYFWTEFQVEARRIAEQLKEQNK